METYHGYVRTPADAIKLFEACRLGLLPRVQRRLSEKERQSIRSGSVFVWDEREAGMRRWTDGKSWSASRVSGSFLTYREMEGKRGTGFGNSRRSHGRTPDSGRMSDEDVDGEPEGYRYKADGLMKQSFSITTSQGQHLHLISYYSRPHPGAPDLPQPSTDPQLRHITPAKGMYPESSLHDSNPPALTRTPMQPYTNHHSIPPPDQPQYPGYTWGQPAWMAPWPPSPSGTPPWVQQPKLSPDTKPLPRPQMASPHMHVHAQAPPQLPPAQLPPQLPPQQLPPQQLPPQLPPPPPTSVPASQPPLYQKYDEPPRPTARPYPPPVNPAPASPRLQQQLQLAQAAAAAMIDPRLAPTSARNPQGPLPAMSASAPTPPRTHSASPPRSSSSDGMPPNRARLSALLHPTPSSSEPNSAHPVNNSAGSSPRALTGGTTGPGQNDNMHKQDTLQLRALDRKFCI